MKKIFLLIFAFCITLMSQALTVNSTAGKLKESIIAAGGNLGAVSSLTVTGVIDSTDFMLMRDSMPMISVVDLSGVTIVENVIPYGAFGGCVSLTNITLPSSVTSIGPEAFGNCISLTTITLPSSLTSIGFFAFTGCASLTSITLPSSLTSIDVYVFWNCNGLTSITIPTSITSIGHRAFEFCSALTSVTIPSSVTSFDDAFSNCVSLTSITIPFSIETIQGWAFYGDSALTTVTIPSSVSFIESGAFLGCTGLTSVYANNPIAIDIPKVYADVFDSVTISNNCTLFVPIGSKSVYQATAKWQDFNQIVEVDTLKTVSASAGNLSATLTTQERNMITHLILTGTIDARDIYFMRDSMPALSILDLQDVSIVGYTGLIDTTLFRSAVIVKTFPANTLPLTSFKNKITLTSITLPASLIDIQNEAFKNCTNLDSITLNNPIPIDLSSTTEVFEGVDKSTCVLAVPAGSESVFRSAAVWQDFLDITNATGVQNTLANNTFQVNVQNGQAILTGLSLGEIITIYNLQGTAIYIQQANSEMVSINLPVRGVYVVKVGNQSVKIIN